MAELFALLNEEDLHYHLLLKSASHESSLAITLEQQGGVHLQLAIFILMKLNFPGLWDKSQEEYQRLMSNHQNDMSMDQSEGIMWEEHFVKCAKHLGQWDLLTEYAKSGPHPELLLVNFIEISLKFHMYIPRCFVSILRLWNKELFLCVKAARTN